jgi:hypothetical protein
MLVGCQQMLMWSKAKIATSHVDSLWQQHLSSGIYEKVQPNRSKNKHQNNLVKHVLKKNQCAKKSNHMCRWSSLRSANRHTRLDFQKKAKNCNNFKTSSSSYRLLALVHYIFFQQRDKRRHCQQLPPQPQRGSVRAPACGTGTTLESPRCGNQHTWPKMRI